MPQLGAEPATAVYTRGELAMERAIYAAAPSLVDPLAAIVIGLRAPSSTFAIALARSYATWEIPASIPAISLGSGRSPSPILDLTCRLSLLDVSPSNEMRLSPCS